MLLEFGVANFASFRDKTQFSLIPTREKMHRRQHVYNCGSKEALRIAFFYGANASGKTNLIRAVEFAKALVTKGTKPNRSINPPPFKLDEAFHRRPSWFYFEILIKDRVYRYQFEVDHDSVVSESLYQRLNTGTKLMFSREVDSDGNCSFEFGKVIERFPKEDRLFYHFTMEGTRPNQLFLAESVERNAKEFKPVYDWFDRSLKIITPRSISHGIEFRIGDDSEFTQFLMKNLVEFDPSVVDIKSDLLDAESVSDIPQRVLSDIESEIDANEAVFISNTLTGTRSVVMKDDVGSLQLLKLRTQHRSSDGSQNVTFELEEESDGTRRLIELAPLFYELMTSNDCTVAFIDELDRSLHPELTKRLVRKFLSSDRTRPSQIIASTHDANLLDTKLVRRDVVWFINKKDGASFLKSLQRDYNPRHDKDIRKEYLDGSYGAVPSFE